MTSKFRFASNGSEVARSSIAPTSASVNVGGLASTSAERAVASTSTTSHAPRMPPHLPLKVQYNRNVATPTPFTPAYGSSSAHAQPRGPAPESTRSFASTVATSTSLVPAKRPLASSARPCRSETPLSPVVRSQTPNTVVQNAAPVAKRPRKSDDSGYGDFSPHRSREDESFGMQVVPNSEDEQGAFEEVDLASVWRNSAGKNQAGGIHDLAGRRDSMLPPEPNVDHLEETPLSVLQDELSTFQDQRVNINEQLLEIAMQGGKGRSSTGNDAGFLRHSLNYVEARVEELKAEIVRRRQSAPAIDAVLPGPRMSSIHRSSSSLLDQATAAHPRTGSYASSESSRASVSRDPPPAQSNATSRNVAAVCSRGFDVQAVPSSSVVPARPARADGETSYTGCSIFTDSVASTSARPSAFRPGGSAASKPRLEPPSVAPASALSASATSRAEAKVPAAAVDLEALFDGVNFDEEDDRISVVSAGQVRGVPSRAPAARPSTCIVIDEDDDADSDDMPIAPNLAARVPIARPAKAPPQRQPQRPIEVRQLVASTSAGEERRDPPAALPARSAAKKSTYPWDKDVDKVLRQRFGLSDFRINQRAAVDGTLSGRDVFVLLPTGGGKSLCYQLPAVVATGKTRGVTVVISPLLSLMEDQCKALADKDIAVVSINSTLPAADKTHAMLCLTNDPPKCSLVYLTPEQVVNSQVMRSTLQNLYRRKQLARFVLDEAHCVSSWGHDFRPDYKAMSCLKQEYPDIPLMALTATASRRVKQDIISNLNMKNPLLLSASFNRPNLHYSVRPKTKAIVQEIIAFIQQDKYREKTGIVYCLSQKQCEDTAMKLQSAGITAHHYHAGMAAKDRSRIQREWQENKISVICATIAFGMGIDKPDVRFVIHYSIPKNLEGYYQETGRGGRDGKTSECVLFYAYGDTATIFHQIREGDGSPEQKDHNRECLRLVVQYCLNLSDCRRKQVLHYFNENFDPNACHKSCDNCLRSGTSEKKDVTELAKMAIKLVKGFGETSRVTLLTAVDIFRGSKTQKIIATGYDKLEGAGSGQGANRGDVERLFQILSSEGVFGEHFERSSLGYTHAYIELGKKYRDILEGRKKVFMDVADPKQIAKVAQALEIAGNPAYQDDFEDEIDDEQEQVRPTWDPTARSTRNQNEHEGGSSVGLEQQCLAELRECRDSCAIMLGYEPEALASDALLETLACLLPVNYKEYISVEGTDEDSHDDFFVKSGAKKVVSKYAQLRASGSVAVAPLPGFSRPVLPPSAKTSTVATRTTSAFAGTSFAPVPRAPTTTMRKEAVKAKPAQPARAKSTVAASGLAKPRKSKAAVPPVARAKSSSSTMQQSLEKFRYGGDSSAKKSSGIKAMAMPKKK